MLLRILSPSSLLTLILVMFSIRPKSTFNYLFGGLLVLLVLTSVEALPTKPKHVTAPSVIIFLPPLLFIAQK
jgi:hypothetical protein